MALQPATIIIHKCMESAVGSISATRELVSKYLEGQELVSAMQELEKLTRNYCDMDNVEAALRTSEVVETEINQGKRLNNSDIDDMHNRNLNEINQPKSPSDYHDNPLWKEVFGESDEVLEVQAKKDRPSASQQYEQVSGEDSIMCSNVFAPPIDPFSKKIIRNPSRNKVCNHVYETDMIHNYLEQAKRKAKCPYVGCRNRKMRMADLVIDDQLASQITTYLSQADSDESDE